MQDFFHSKNFKVLLVIFALLMAFLLRAVYTGGLAPLASTVGGWILDPLTELSSRVSSAVSSFVEPYLHAGRVSRENEELKQQVRDLTQQLVDYEQYRNENVLFRQYLEIKEYNTDFQFEPASVIGRSADDRFGSFTLDVGTYHGVQLRCPVITEDGLVGIVTSVSYSHCEVSTLLDPTIQIGAIDTRTQDTGLIRGTVPLSVNGLCQLYSLPRESGIAAGDVITTSGIGNLFPKGLVIGTVQEVSTESTGLTLSASILPAADITGCKNVFVIKDFALKASYNAGGN